MKIEFDIPQTFNAKVTIYDILGKEIASLKNEKLNPGAHEIDITGMGLPDGTYFCKIESEGISQTRKIVITK